MTTGTIPIPVEVIGGNDAMIMLGRIVNALEQTGKKSEEAAPKARDLGVSIGGIADAARSFNEVAESVGRITAALGAAADQITALASEQERLDANSARLGLNFDEGAAAAGRFADETEAMTAATRLAAAGVHLTQTELNALMRVAGSTSQALGIDVADAAERLSQGLLSGSRNALRPFGHDLEELATRSHTAGERIDEMVRIAARTPQAVDSAADSVNRFRDSIDDARRTIATGFTTEFRRLSELGAPFREAASDAEEFNRSMQAIGHTAALMVAQVGNAVAIAGASVALIGSWAAERVGGSRQRTDDLVAFLRGRYASFAAINADQGERTTAGGSTTDVARPDMDLRGDAGALGDIAASERQRAEAERRARTSRGERRRGGAGPRRETVEDLMRRAISGSRPEARLAPETPDAATLAAQERARQKAAQEAQNEYERSGAGIGAAVANDNAQRTADRARRALRDAARDLGSEADERRADARYQRELDYRVDQTRTFTEQLEELSHRRITAAQEEASTVAGAFNAMGRAFSDHLIAVVEGREELGVALQGMLSDTLRTISQEAAVKAGLNLAEGIAAIATYRYDAAAEHFAAMAAYTAVAGLAGGAAALTAPSSAKSSGAGGSAASAANDNGRSATPMSGGSSSSRGDTVINVAFNGPQFGTGGVVQAAREIVGVINRGAVQGGVQLNTLAVGGLR